MLYPCDETLDFLLSIGYALVVTYNLDNTLIQVVAEALLGDEDARVCTTSDALKVLTALANDQADVAVRDTNLLMVAMEGI